MAGPPGLPPPVLYDGGRDPAVLNDMASPCSYFFDHTRYPLARGAALRENPTSCQSGCWRAVVPAGIEHVKRHTSQERWCLRG